MARKRKDSVAKPQAPGKGPTQGGSASKSKAKKKSKEMETEELTEESDTAVEVFPAPRGSATLATRTARTARRAPLPDEIDIEEEDLEAPDTPTPPSRPQRSSLRPNISPIVPLAPLAPLALEHEPVALEVQPPAGLDPILDPPYLHPPRSTPRISRSRQHQPDPDSQETESLLIRGRRRPNTLHQGEMETAIEEELANMSLCTTPSTTPSTTPRRSTPRTPRTPSGIPFPVGPRPIIINPRTGPGPNHLGPSPKKAKKKQGAKDVWSFYEEDEITGLQTCVICKAVNYSDKTSSSTLRKHLYTTHLDFWVETCDQMGIDITAKEALPFLEGYRLDAEEDVSKIPRLAYSKEAFLDAICEFIISDDQASIFIFYPRTIF
ncbi:hypothetical protein K435DRAFT_851723 [Dendrothele bispora CBS 962.96]|uniref:BED-type domain-containing protein n=1 Tax=Dendrothele bispora (strain CBS 962.96) TaxID=1314807 RepID=A0A4S8MLB3_DENBC|nr:hypothetical protein K435DRAFT_851723 [Dendrothele bispora CBS 962.96]